MSINFIFKLFNYFINFDYVSLPNDQLLLISATQAAELIRNKEITSTELLNAYLDRIEIVDSVIKAVVVKHFEAAKETANQVDKYLANIDTNSDEYKNLKYTKPLLGVPFTLKDSISLKGSVLSCGMVCRKNSVAEEDAIAVKRMKNAGAIAICITNVPEVCMWWESVNKVYGRSSNPYDNRRITGGSSGGEAALIASAGSIIGLGSDIGGSIRMPSFFNGVFGLKPTPGVIPIDGHYPMPVGYRNDMLTIGPICRYAKDLSLMLTVLAGDLAESQLELNRPINIRKTKVYYMEGVNHPLIETISSDMKETLRKAVKYFEKKYDIHTYKVDFNLARNAIEYFFASMDVEGSDKFGKIMLDGKGEIDVKMELLNGLIGQSDHTLPAVITAALDKVGLFPETKKKHLFAKRDKLKREIINLLKDDGILLFPSFPTTAPYHNQPMFTPFNFSYTALWNVLGLPVVQCPMGLTRSINNPGGVPLGVQVIGSPNSDALLIAIAKDLEDGFGGWVLPH
uniref:Fatty-acid amide hydrolase 2 (inferred by orthology to a human protein) n=1 Tax=Strongyloides venezuelensis TaxID=75913 RepID=A0A0K0FUP7_STRVS